ncbi:MAG: helix-turn-helix domain-containing protein, partial [Spirochaetota bacterium]
IIVKKKKGDSGNATNLNGKDRHIHNNTKHSSKDKTNLKHIIPKKDSDSNLNSDSIKLPSEYIKTLIKENKSTKEEDEHEFSSLRDIRKYLKLSQTELGEALNINQRKISIWEITNANLSKEVIEKISAKFDIPFEKLEHLIESDETSYLIENLPITTNSPFYDKETDTLNIQVIRKTFEHSLRSFAKKIGVHYQTVARWEKGKGIPKDYVLKKIIDKFLNRESIKNLIDKGYDVGLKEEYAHWKYDNENEDIETLETGLTKNEMTKILDEKLELLKRMEEEGIEVDSVQINSKKNITIRSNKDNFKSIIVLTEDAKNELKKLFE